MTRTVPIDHLPKPDPALLQPQAPQRLSAHGKLWIASVVVLMAAGWADTLRAMWLRWFPAWQVEGFTLGQHIGEGDSYYTHGPLVPLVSLLLTVVIYRRIGAPVDRTRRAAAVGWTVLVVSMAMHLVSVYAGIMFVSGLAMVAVITGIVLVRGGWVLMRAYWLPIIYLLFMIPLPMHWIAALNFHLKTIAGGMALGLTVNIFSIPAVQHGSHILLDGGKTLIVEDICGGLRSLIALMCFASLFAMICRVRGGWRLLLLLMAAPVAIGCNALRIAFLILVAQFGDVQSAGAGSWYHGLSGILVFALAIGVLFGAEAIVVAIGRRLHRSWTDARLLGYLQDLRQLHNPTSMRSRRAAPITLLAVGAVISLFWSSPSNGRPHGDIARNAVPSVVQLGDATFHGHDMTLDRRTRTMLETNDYLYRRFTAVKDDRWFDLLIVYSAGNRKGAHPPEVYLAGSGEQVMRWQPLEIDVAGITPIEMCELATQHDLHRRFYLYVYKCGDDYTTSYATQQAQLLLRGLTNRRAAGALIRISTQTQPGYVTTARDLIRAAADKLMPIIDGNLK